MNRARQPRALTIIALWATLPACALYEDFEAQSLAAWRATSVNAIPPRGAVGTNGIASNNGGPMAFVTSEGSNQSSLSIDFPYSARGFVSFDMQAHSVPYLGFSLHAGAGVTLSFLSSLNVPLGSVSFQNLTSPDQQPANVFKVDDRQHTYTAKMSEFAGLAGLAQDAAIAKVNLSFGTWGASSISFRSSGIVWFGRVAVTSQDDAIACLLGWAERMYPGAVAPSGPPTRFSTPYVYRFYPATDAYVGVSVKDNHVYFLDAGRNLRDLGDLPGWLNTADCRATS